MKPTISAVIITRNEAEMLSGLLESLTFCDEIVVVDSHSDDATRDIAASFDAKVITRDFNGFGDQKEFARTQASCEWVLSMDADERVPPSLAEEIVSTLADPAFDAYQVPRLSYFLGKPFRHSGWWPDAPLRLFRRDAARFNSKLVHEFAETDGPTGTLSSHMDHFTVRSLEQALAKGQHYSALGAQQLEKTGRRVTLLSPFGHENLCAQARVSGWRRGAGECVDPWTDGVLEIHDRACEPPSRTSFAAIGLFEQCNLRRLSGVDRSRGAGRGRCRARTCFAHVRLRLRHIPCAAPSPLTM